MNEIIILSVIIVIASLIQGTAGFGFSLFCLPLLSLFMPLQQIVPLVVIASLMTNIIVVVTVHKHIRLKDIWLMIVAGFVGIPMGVLGLKVINPEILKIVVGVLITLTALFMIKGIKVTFKNKNLAFAFTGLLSGLLNGSLSLSGPPIVLFLSNENYNKNEFRANLMFYATVTNIFTIITLTINGIFTKSSLNLVFYMLPALFIGTGIGILITKNLKEENFRKIVLHLLSYLGLFTVIKEVYKLMG